MRSVFFARLGLILCLLLGSKLWSQSTEALMLLNNHPFPKFAGHQLMVVDFAGKALLGAKIETFAFENGQRQSVPLQQIDWRDAGEGIYQLDSIPPGCYHLRITAPGFQGVGINAFANHATPIGQRVMLGRSSQRQYYVIELGRTTPLPAFKDFVVLQATQTSLSSEAQSAKVKDFIQKLKGTVPGVDQSKRPEQAVSWPKGLQDQASFEKAIVQSSTVKSSALLLEMETADLTIYPSFMVTVHTLPSAEVLTKCLNAHHFSTEYVPMAFSTGNCRFRITYTKVMSKAFFEDLEQLIAALPITMVSLNVASSNGPKIPEQRPGYLHPAPGPMIEPAR